MLDLTRPEVAGYLLERISGLLSEYEISYVKWDCNRDIIDAGSGARAGAPAAHSQALAVYAPTAPQRACGRPGFPACRSPAPRWPKSASRSRLSGP